MLIKTIAYKFESKDTNWIMIPVQIDSAVYHENSSSVRQGSLLNAQCTAYSPSLKMWKDSLFQKLTALGGLFLLVTHTSDKYYLGTDTLKATFNYEKLDGDKPGSKSGYNIKIELKTTPDALYQSFDMQGDDGNIVVID